MSKAWDWTKNTYPIWLNPSEESYYIANAWKEKGVKNILDFGCGLGRHSVFFSQQGFQVSAFDLSKEATEHLREWAIKEGITVDIINADMLQLPYCDNLFDGLFAYHVISHTDSVGIRKIVSEMTRVLKLGGQVYLSLCSKESWSFKHSGYPKLDANTVIKTEDGPEKDVPHYYVDIDDILELFCNFDIERIRHTDDCYVSGQKIDSKHFFVSAKLRTK